MSVFYSMWLKSMLNNGYSPFLSSKNYFYFMLYLTSGRKDTLIIKVFGCSAHFLNINLVYS